MINPATESFGQARQGSVAAIIQVLNERLSDSGIRTRAVVADDTLQLLCEAATPEQLEKSTVVERVRAELETISPQRIKKVKINSRIVKEEQLLWLEEINRNPEKALLWSEVITLKRPFFVKRWIRDRHLRPAGPIFKDITQPEPSRNSFLGKVLGSTGLVLLLLAAGWLFRDDLGRLQRVGSIIPTNAAETTEDTPPAITDTAVATAPSTPAASTPDRRQENQGQRTADTTPPQADSFASSLPPRSTRSSSPTGPSLPANDTTAANPNSAAGSAAETYRAGSAADAFAEAVRIAEQAGVDGQSASTAAEWLGLAARWQKASDLMSNIPQEDEQYAIAQDRIKTYQANSQSALQQANAAQAQ